MIRFEKISRYHVGYNLEKYKLWGETSEVSYKEKSENLGQVMEMEVEIIGMV